MSALPKDEVSNSELTRLDRFDHCLEYLRTLNGINENDIAAGCSTVDILDSLGMDEQGRIAGLLYCICPQQTCFDADDLYKGLWGSLHPTVLSLHGAVAHLDQLSSFSRHGGDKANPEVNEDILGSCLWQRPWRLLQHCSPLLSLQSPQTDQQ